VTVTAAKFAASVNQAFGLLTKLGVMGSRSFDARYPAGMPASLRALSYRAAWEKCAELGWYDFRLVDASLLQFHREENHLSYSFLEAPLTALAFEDFAAESVGEEWSVLEEELRSDYELYLSSDLAERSVTPVRYDYEPDLYRSGLHPAGHFHFGVNNHIRVCAAKILTPLSFVLFILRQFYPQKWEILLADEKSKRLFREVRSSLDAVSVVFFRESDFHELHLT
jgi:hypothetical protein